MLTPESCDQLKDILMDLWAIAEKTAVLQGKPISKAKKIDGSNFINALCDQAKRCAEARADRDRWKALNDEKIEQIFQLKCTLEKSEKKAQAIQEVISRELRFWKKEAKRNKNAGEQQREAVCRQIIKRLEAKATKAKEIME